MVSERLGHASVTLTLDTYSHVLPEMQEQATALLSEARTAQGLAHQHDALARSRAIGVQIPTNQIHATTSDPVHLCVRYSP